MNFNQLTKAKGNKYNKSLARPMRRYLVEYTREGVILHNCAEGRYHLDEKGCIKRITA